MSVFSQDIAEESWHKYLHRNQSVIVRVFQGQLKSTLICPKCKLVRRTITCHTGGKEGSQDSMYTSNTHIHALAHTLTYEINTQSHTCTHVRLTHNHTHTSVITTHTSHTLPITLTPLSSQHMHTLHTTHTSHSGRFPKSLIPSCSCHCRFLSRRHVPSL